MSPETQQRLTAQLAREEGYRKSAYQDSLGYWTIGYGRLIDGRKGAGLSLEEAAYLLGNDITSVLEHLAAYPWFTDQDEVRQAALADMAFNLGVEGLQREWPHFLGAMALKDYPRAGDILEHSLWRQQVGPRAERIIKQIRTGEWA